MMGEQHFTEAQDSEWARNAVVKFAALAEHLGCDPAELEGVDLVKLVEALKYYKNRIHWMGETENSEFQNIFLAGQSWDMNGWHVAELALAQLPEK